MAGAAYSTQKRFNTLLDELETDEFAGAAE
jgi:hypothetical protein